MKDTLAKRFRSDSTPGWVSNAEAIEPGKGESPPYFDDDVDDHVQVFANLPVYLDVEVRDSLHSGFNALCKLWGSAIAAVLEGLDWYSVWWYQNIADVKECDSTLAAGLLPWNACPSLRRPLLHCALVDILR